MVSLPRRCRSVHFLVASVSLAFAAGNAVQTSVAREAGNDGPIPAGSQAPALPDFAKTVQVRVDGKLIFLDKAVRQNAADPQLKKYRELRAVNAATPAGQLELARWCRKQKMAEEERLHWLTLLNQKPGHPEAIKGLQLRRYQGLLLTADEIKQFKQQQAEADHAAKKWLPKLKKLKLAIEHGGADERTAAIDELRLIRDPLALPSIEDVFGFDSATLGVAIVEIAGNIPGGQGAEFLARMAVNSADPYVREKAAEKLKDRPYSMYVPTLIAGLAAPIELSVNVSVKKGHAKYEEIKWEEFTGRLVPGMYNKIRLHSKYTNADVLWWEFEVRQRSGYLMTDYQPDRLQFNYLLSRDSPNPEKQYEASGTLEAQGLSGKNSRRINSVEDLDKRVKEMNEKQAALNDKIHAALSKATGVSVVPADQFGTPNPQVWWEWWKKQSEINCYFAHGTEVWTQTGPVAIEQVVVGDRVLARGADTKELAFHLVIAKHEQPNGEMREMEIDSRTIVATPEQQFMVAEKGWRKAIDLEAGSKIERLSDPHSVEKVRSCDGAAMYNLVMADVPNYFVDRSGVLVHDASRR
jgi:hypothetical protein